MPIQSQFALLSSYSFITSMLRRPWDVARIVLGSTPSSAPILVFSELEHSRPKRLDEVIYHELVPVFHDSY